MSTAAQVSSARCPERLRLSALAGFRERAVQAWVQRHLQQGMLVRSDGLACFRGAQVAGCERQAQSAGGSKCSCETPGLTWVNTLLGSVKRAIEGTYHVCEALNAGRYLAESAYRFNRRYELADLGPRLVYVPVRTPALPDRPLAVAGTAGQ